MFQYPERQLFAETVVQDVAFGPHNLGLSQAEVARRVESSLARVGLDLATVGDKSPLSSRAGSSGAWRLPACLLWSPRSWYSMNPWRGSIRRRAVISWSSSIDFTMGGLTVVMVSHSMDDLANCCDRIVVMNEGAVFAEGTPAQVLRMRMSSSRSAWAYLLLSAWRWRSRRRACRCVAAGSIRLSRWPTSWQIC